MILWIVFVYVDEENIRDLKISGIYFTKEMAISVGKNDGREFWIAPLEPNEHIIQEINFNEWKRAEYFLNGRSIKNE